MTQKQVAVLWAVVLAAPAPLFIAHLINLWPKDAYGYFPALLMALILLVGSRWDRVPRGPMSIAAFTLLFAGLLVILPGAAWMGSPWLGALSWILILGAFLLSNREKDPGSDDESSLQSLQSRRQTAATRSLASIWLLSWMLLPLPMNLDQDLTTNLQRRTASFSSYLLDSLEVPHVALGNVFELAGGRLLVEEACSGVQSLFTVIFCSLLLIVAFRRSIILLPIYLASAIIFAALMNICRIVAIAWVQDRYGWDWAHGTQHAVLGYACLTVACALLISTDRLIRVLFYPTKPAIGDSTRINPLVEAWNSAFGQAEYTFDAHEVANRPLVPNRTWSLNAFYPAIVVSVLLIGSQSAVLLMRAMRTQDESSEPGAAFLAPPDKLPNEAVPTFVQTNHEVLHGRRDMPMGENADVWRGTISGFPVAVTLSQPYPEWHDLTVCYRGTGWTLNDQTVKTDSEYGDRWDYVLSRWVTSDGTYAYVWFSAFDEFGAEVPTISYSLSYLTRERFTDGQSKPGIYEKLGRVAMVQMIVETDAVLPPDTLQFLEENHLKSRDWLRKSATSR